MPAEGTLTAALFALAPNSRSYCGKPSFANALRAFLAAPDSASRSRLQKELSRFTAHYSYLRLIARKNGLKPFDARVAEALWLGNSLLAKVKREDLQRMILRNFCGPGMLSKKMAKELAGGMPDGFLAHHSFHALYLHTISGVIGPSVRNADDCRVSWGKVVRMGGGRATLKSQRLVRKGGKLRLVPFARTVRLACRGIRLIPRLAKGDLLACHWGVAVMKLSPRQALRLERATRQNIAAANNASV